MSVCFSVLSSICYFLNNTIKLKEIYVYLCLIFCLVVEKRSQQKMRKGKR